jgi:hypothetical protein
MPRYFFTVRRSDNQIEADPHGTILPDDAAALCHAERIIKDLQSQRGCEHPGPMMLVESEGRRTVLALPFFPGWA